MSDENQLKGAFAGLSQQQPELTANEASKEQATTDDTPSQQAPKADVVTGTDNPSIEAKPQPVAQETETKTENQDADAIRDPEAWARAQVEKYQRLQAKANKEAKDLRARLLQIEESKQAEFKARLDEVEAGLQAQVNAALETAKETAIKSLGLSEEQATKAKALLTATDAETLQAQIEGLTVLIPKGTTARPAVGNSGESAKPSMAQQIHARNKQSNRDPDVWGRIAQQRE